MKSNSTTRFSDRVAYYIKYRPGYPAKVITLLNREIGLSPATVIADIGSGTGISSELFLKNGNRVFGVEPNQPMREAAESRLAGYDAFISINGTAEATTLPDASVDLVTAGQAFHWFDPDQARREFMRILKPGGAVALLWNDRRIDTTAFLQAYEAVLLDYATDYREVNHRNVSDEMLSRFFGSGGFTKAVLPNSQLFDYAGLEGRLLSSSYVPAPGHPNYDPMLKRLREIFDAHQMDHCISFDYDTQVFSGRIV